MQHNSDRVAGLVAPKYGSTSFNGCAAATHCSTGSQECSDWQQYQEGLLDSTRGASIVHCSTFSELIYSSLKEILITDAVDDLLLQVIVTVGSLASGMYIFRVWSK